ncbi:unnamed protein product [Microthlaspi erraticum]|uniref:Retrotransposon gag domain-containing protein n=1 Tax=Microthlaspi erraticum TaxID=1685480 RepID=A0A6D2HV98_9BRAS|nr:unnamed protein product [Microthlaspi erraticum]
MGNYSLHMNLDRVEAWPVELRNSTGWSSRRSSWSSRWLLPSSFAYPVELRPCAKSLHAPHPICSRMLQKTYFKGPNMHIDKASRWLKSLPAHSITTWDEYKAAFINHFYTKQRSISVRNKISNFRQANNESFYEALDRFKEYIRDCPNHGFNEGNLWNIFYRGIDHKYKLSLDTASNGNFMTKTVDEAKVLIENLAASDCNNCPDYDRSSRTTTSSPDSFQMTELKNMMADDRICVWV